MLSNRVRDVLKPLLVIERSHSSAPMVGVICVVYVLYVAKRFPGITDVKRILRRAETPDELASFILNKVEDHWDAYKPMLTSFAEEDLAEVFVDNSWIEDFGRVGAEHSALPVVDLVVKALGLKTGESVCDIGSGFGDFVRAAYFATTDFKGTGKVVGYEISVEAAAISKIRMLANDCDVEIVKGDVFNDCTNSATFDKVYCCPPFCLQLARNPGLKEFLAKRLPDFPAVSPFSHCDWIFAARAYAAMKKDGKAAVILPASAMFSARAEDFRRYFLDKRLIEAVVELPDLLLNYTGITTYLVILSEGNDKVKMVKATNLCERGRFRNAFRKEHIEQIAAMLAGEHGDENMVEVDRARLMEDDCNLTILRHFADPVAVKDGVPFREFVICAKRGAPIASKELDRLVTDDDTGIYYATTGNLNDGVIDEMPTRLVTLPEDYRDFCVRDGDLVISRVMAKGAAFKVAVAELREGKTLLPNGNLLVITLDRAKTDPYYVKSYLETEYAQKYLQNASVGNSVMTLQYKNLEQLPVPNLAIERQREIGEKCREALHRVIQEMRHLKEAKADLSTVFVDNAPDCFEANKENG